MFARKQNVYHVDLNRAFTILIERLRNLMFGHSPVKLNKK